MEDTTPEMAQKMVEMIQKKSPAERCQMGSSMNALSRAFVVRSILEENRYISYEDLKKELFLKFHGDEFSEMEIDKIFASFKKNPSSEFEQTLNEFYRFIQTAFQSYFIALEGAKSWRLCLEKYKAENRSKMQEAGYDALEIERRIAEMPFHLEEEDFKVHYQIKDLNQTLTPGKFEEMQAKYTLIALSNEWARFKSPIQGDIWNDLEKIHHYITQGTIGDEQLKDMKILKDFNPELTTAFDSAFMSEIQKKLEEWYYTIKLTW